MEAGSAENKRLIRFRAVICSHLLCCQLKAGKVLSCSIRGSIPNIWASSRTAPTFHATSLSVLVSFFVFLSTHAARLSLDFTLTHLQERTEEAAVRCALSKEC